MIKDTSWVDQGKCLSDPVLFEVTAYGAADRVSGKANKDNINRAKKLCITCPVRATCLEDAMTEEAYLGGSERHGIRGGLTAKDRILLADRDPMCARCQENPVLQTDKVEKMRRLCSICQSSTQGDLTARYFPPNSRSLKNILQTN